jgi:hypothetical protein
MKRNDDTADKGRATTRRRFLGAAAAAAGLAGFTGTSTATTSTGSDNGTDLEVSDVNAGARHASAPTRDTEAGWMDLGLRGADTDISIDGYHYDDGEYTEVEVNIITDLGSFNVYLSPTQARTVAEDLKAAADFTEGQHGGH